VITLSGKLIANVIYLSQDNQILSAETMMDFIEKQQILTVLQEKTALDEVSIKVHTFSGTEILCSVTHNTHIFGIYSYEIADFVGIQEDLERISVTVETLQLWCERMLANGVINEDKYKEFKSRRK
jgi:hypothetical protein